MQPKDICTTRNIGKILIKQSKNAKTIHNVLKTHETNLKLLNYPTANTNTNTIIKVKIKNQRAN